MCVLSFSVCGASSCAQAAVCGVFVDRNISYMQQHIGSEANVHNAHVQTDEGSGTSGHRQTTSLLSIVFDGHMKSNTFSLSFFSHHSLFIFQLDFKTKTIEY